MSARTGLERVPTPDLVLAIILLVGVLIVGYGYFNSSTTALYLGLFIIAGGVISGVIRIVTQDR